MATRSKTLGGIASHTAHDGAKQKAALNAAVEELVAENLVEKTR
jgi:hypothetical protein